MPIVQVIPPFTTPAPTRADPSNFPARADVMMGELQPFVAAANTFATQANSTAVDVNTLATTATTQAATSTAQAVIAAAQAVAAANSAATAINAPGTQATSVTSVALAVGTMVLTVQTGKTFAVGQHVFVASTASLGNFAQGQISAYVTGTGVLTITIQSINGSGTFAAWSVTAGARDPIAGMLGLMPNLEPTLF